MPFATGNIMDLPASHHLAVWPKLDLLDGCRFCLGPSDAAFLNNRPRSWYATSTVCMWTARARTKQIERMTENALAAGLQAVRELRDRDGIDCEAPHRPTTCKAPDRRDVLKSFDCTGANQDWAEPFIYCLRVAMDSRKIFVPPDDRIALEEILRVRVAFDVKDEDIHPVPYAAIRHAALVAGHQRNELLVHALSDAARTIVSRIERELSSALLKAALQCCE
jgi:hypothetical protein